MAKIWMLLLVLTLLQMQEWEVSSECCTATKLSFTVNKKKNSCFNYPGGKNRYFWSHDVCKTSICEDLTLPTPCCGVGKCNIFCCDCKGDCRRPAIDVVHDFRKKYSDELRDVFEIPRSTLPVDISDLLP